MNPPISFLPLSAGPLPNAEQVDALSRTSENRAELAQHVAKEFDAVFYSMLLKQMRQTIGDEGLFGGDQADTLGGLFDLYMGRHLAESSELGIGRAVAQYVNVAKTNESNL